MPVLLDDWLRIVEGCLSQGAVERFFCGSGGRVKVSKCSAELGTSFADGRAGRDGRLESGGQCSAASVDLGVRGRLRKRSEAPGLVYHLVKSDIFGFSGIDIIS